MSIRSRLLGSHSSGQPNALALGTTTQQRFGLPLESHQRQCESTGLRNGIGLAPMQLVEIIKVVGTPTKEEILAMNRNYTEFKFPQVPQRCTFAALHCLH